MGSNSKLRLQPARRGYCKERGLQRRVEVEASPTALDRQDCEHILSRSKGDAHFLTAGVEFTAGRSFCSAEASVFPAIAAVYVSSTCLESALATQLTSSNSVLQSLSVYAAATDDEVKEMIRLRQVQWCGWEYFIGNTPDHCILHISPFIDTVVAVTQPKPTGILVQKNSEFSPLPVSLTSIH